MSIINHSFLIIQGDLKSISPSLDRTPPVGKQAKIVLISKMDKCQKIITIRTKQNNEHFDSGFILGSGDG